MKVKYRVKMTKYDSYDAQKKVWWLPFWYSINSSFVSFRTKDLAETFIDHYVNSQIYTPKVHKEVL